MRVKIRSALFQFHWLFGITAGLVLCVMGVTGASLVFEREILEILNPHVLRATPGAEPALAPTELLQRAQRVRPERQIVGLNLFADAELTPRVSLVSVPDAKNARPRAEWYYIDPRNATWLGSERELRGHSTLHFLEDLHRKLATGDAGKAVTGASTLVLIYLCCTGLYLRWPRHARNWRSWLQVRWQRKGRHFLWELHTVAGTGLLLLYLLSALTGLYWAYDWYKDGLLRLTGTPRAEQQPLSDARREHPDLAKTWDTFLQESSGFSSATLRLPDRPGDAIQITYLSAQAPHERAFSKMTLEPGQGRVLAHERYADKAAGGQLIASLFPLHSGSFFGWPGRILMFLSGLCMPLFAVTGWMLYLDRRRKRKVSEVLLKQRQKVAQNDAPLRDLAEET